MKNIFITTVSLGVLVSSFPALAMNDDQGTSLTIKRPLPQSQVDLTAVTEFLLSDMRARTFRYSPKATQVTYDEFRADLRSFLLRKEAVTEANEFKLIFDGANVTAENFHQLAPNFNTTTLLRLVVTRS